MIDVVENDFDIHINIELYIELILMDYIEYWIDFVLLKKLFEENELS